MYLMAETNVHELNLINYKWRDINPTNPEEGPLCKGGAGMVDYGGNVMCNRRIWLSCSCEEFSASTGSSFHLGYR